MAYIRGFQPFWISVPPQPDAEQCTPNSQMQSEGVACGQMWSSSRHCVWASPTRPHLGGWAAPAQQCGMVRSSTLPPAGPCVPPRAFSSTPGVCVLPVDNPWTIWIGRWKFSLLWHYHKIFPSANSISLDKATGQPVPTVICATNYSDKYNPPDGARKLGRLPLCLPSFPAALIAALFFQSQAALETKCASL